MSTGYSGTLFERLHLGVRVSTQAKQLARDRSSSLQSQLMWGLDGARCRAHLALRQAWACRKPDGKCVIRVCLCLGNCSLDDSKREGPRRGCSIGSEVPAPHQGTALSLGGMGRQPSMDSAVIPWLTRRDDKATRHLRLQWTYARRWVCPDELHCTITIWRRG